MTQLIHADGFFNAQDAKNLLRVAQNLNFSQSSYGLEVKNFNLISPDIEIIFHKVVGERVTVDPVRSGILRKPCGDAVWFESFESTEEWCFVVALEPTVVNFYHHVDQTLHLGDLSPVNGHNALNKVDYNFNNLFEWKIHTNIYLDINQCLFFRPWLFHNMHDGVIQYYRLLADTKCRVLVMGMPGSSRAKLASMLNDRLGTNSSLLRSFDIRKDNKDLDFTVDGQMRHCYRMLKYARSSSTIITIIDMACPLPKMREILNADLIVWCSDNTESPYPEFNAMWQPPLLFDAECRDSDDATVDLLMKKLMSLRLI